MQNVTPIPHSLHDAFWLVVAIILASASGGGGYKLIDLIVNRRKPGAEIHGIEAQSAKVFAESRSIDLQTNISAGEAVLRMVQQLTFAQIANENLHKRIEQLESENRLYEEEIQWAKGVFKMRGLSWKA